MFRTAANAPAQPKDLRRCRVEASTHLPGVGGKNIGVGQTVDMDEMVGAGQRVRDLFPEDWFEAIADEPAQSNEPAPAPSAPVVEKE